MASPHTPLKQMNKLSLLIGSGFSVPADYPTTTELNDRLRKIDASEICVDTGRGAWFLNGQPAPNASWMRVKEAFVQEFLEFYNSTVLQPGKSFHYETFYDYYISAYCTRQYSDDLKKFLTDFCRRNPNEVISKHNLLMEFNDTFSQLLATQLTKPLKRAHQCKPYGPGCSGYSEFLLMLEDFSANHSVHIHTLNHDLYFESLSLTDAIHGDMDDGFDDLGSDIYAQKEDDYAIYMVRLRRFTDKYERPFCLYKLHGSIDNFWASFGTQHDLVKIPCGLSNDDIHKEVSNNGKLEYVYKPSLDVVGDFLSGTTHKVNQYEHGPYYPIVLEHFRKNLAESSNLIVIGYGFGDSRISSYMEEHFLNDPGKVMFVIDIKKPSVHCCDRDNVHFLPGGISRIDRNFISKNLAT